MSQDTDSPGKSSAGESEFLTSNAEFFAQSFASLNKIFENSGTMNIVCEETKITVVAGIAIVSDDGALDVNCVLLKPRQSSLRDCINTLFTKD